MKTNLGELIFGDSLEILKTIPDKSIDLILTDPPYLCPDIAKKLENKEKHIEYNIGYFLFNSNHFFLNE